MQFDENLGFRSRGVVGEYDDQDVKNEVDHQLPVILPGGQGEVGGLQQVKFAQYW